MAPRLLFALILSLVVCPPAVAQYRVTTWTTEHGLPQSSVNAIAQTPDGFIWVATLGGLARFDGRTFRTFDTTTNPELPHTRFGGLVVDGAGQLWVTLQTREVMRFAGDRFQVMGEADGVPAAFVDRMYLQHGRIRLDTARGSVIWQGGRFADEPGGPPEDARHLTFAGVSSGNGARWYRDTAGKAYRFEDSRLTRTIDLPGRWAFEDRSGRVWALSIGGALVSLDGGTLRTHGIPAGQLGLETLAPVEDPDGTLWFFSTLGLVRFRDNRFTSYTTADGLPDNYLRAIMKDREGTHWVGTNTGLSRLIEQSITSFTAEDGLAADNTYPVLEDRDGTIWIGGWPGLTTYQNGRFAAVSLPGVNGRTLNVLSLMEDRGGAVWVGTMGAGIIKITSGRVEVIAGSQVLEMAHVIYQSRGSDIWVGTSGGLARYRDGTFTRLRRTDGNHGGETGVVFEDSKGTVWVGNMAGLARVVDNVVVQVGDDNGFTGKRVRAIYEDASGTLWFGTYDTGLFRYRDGRFLRFTVREGLPTNGAFRIIEDEQARFWISSNVGIYRVDRAALDAVAEGRERMTPAVLYGRDDGMASQEANGLGQPSGLRARDGRIWFPTQRGVAILDPASMKQNTAPPPVALLDVSVGGFPTAARDRIEIRSGSREFQVRYAALTFIRPELARFKYRMEGLDADWVDAGTDRTVRYADLPFGTFRFRVIAANRDGVWNEEGASIVVAVIPPFYRTTWFMALMLSLVATTAYGGHRWRLAGIERTQAVQQAFARQLIDSQELDRKRIASELHDGVSQTLVVIRNWARIATPSMPPESPGGKRLGDIADAATQALGEVRNVVHDLLPLHLERMGLVEAMRDAATRVGDASGIAITTRFDHVDTHVSTETALKLFRVAQEGLNNVVKHSGATGASIDVALESAQVRLTIQDNGKGFEPDDVSPTSAGDGFGLVGMAERARMMGGDFTITSAPGRGTTIIIVVPRSAAPAGLKPPPYEGNAQQGGDHA